MSNNGKPLEKVIRLIQEALKDHPETVIYSNYKIKNISNRDREIDIFIETKINEIIIRIAIECKSYKKAISVEKIESFKGKCDRIPGINKMIFVSENGYQADAINAAEDFGMDLYDLKKINSEVILQWLPITQLAIRFNVKNYSLLIDETTLEEFKELEKESAINVYIEEKKENKLIDDIITNMVLEKKGELWSIMISLLMVNDGQKFIGKVTEIPLKITFSGVKFISKDGKKFNVAGIDANINTWFIVTEPAIKNSQLYATKNQTKAGRITLNCGESSETADFIFTADKIKAFYTNENGITTELKTLAKYDPKTKEFTPYV